MIVCVCTLSYKGQVTHVGLGQDMRTAEANLYYHYSSGGPNVPTLEELAADDNCRITRFRQEL